MSLPPPFEEGRLGIPLAAPIRLVGAEATRGDAMEGLPYCVVRSSIVGAGVGERGGPVAFRRGVRRPG